MSGRQILLQVKFAAIDRTALTQIGFNLFSTNDKILGGLTTGQFPAARFSPLTVQGGAVNSQTVNSFPGPAGTRHSCNQPRTAAPAGSPPAEVPPVPFTRSS